MWIQKDKDQEERPTPTQPPVAQVENNENSENKEEPSKQEEEKKEMTITQEQADSGSAVYTIENLREEDDINIEITFGSSSSFRALVDDKELADPARQIYSYKTVLNIREKAVPNKKIQLGFGYMQNNKIKVNDKEVEIPSALSNKSGSALIEFHVKGE